MSFMLPEWVVFLFFTLVAWVGGAVLLAFRSISKRPTTALALRIGFYLWLGVPGVLAYQGVLANFDAMPPMLMRIVVPMMIAIVVFSLSRYGRIVAERLSLLLLVGFQVFRLPLEILLHRLGEEGAISMSMTYSGFNFDIVTGITALVVWVLLLLGKAPKRLVLGWNILGLVLLAVVVTIAILGFPQPFGLFQPPNVIVAFFPWVWLPTFLVQAALVGHLLVFRKLLSEEQSKAVGSAEEGSESVGT